MICPQAAKLAGVVDKAMRKAFLEMDGDGTRKW